METLLGVKELNTQIDSTDNYGVGIPATRHPPTDNNGNSLPPNKNSAYGDISVPIATEERNNIWYKNMNSVTITINRLLLERYSVTLTLVVEFITHGYGQTCNYS